MELYTVSHGGLEYTVQLSPDTAQSIGAEPVSASQEEPAQSIGAEPVSASQEEPAQSIGAEPVSASQEEPAKVEPTPAPKKRATRKNVSRETSESDPDVSRETSEELI